jgi:hypothetical protein
MKATVKSRTLALLPSVQYGNITLESAVELEQEVSTDGDISELQDRANKLVVESLKEQKEAVNKFEREFFKVKI